MQGMDHEGRRAKGLETSHKEEFQSAGRVGWGEPVLNLHPWASLKQRKERRLWSKAWFGGDSRGVQAVLGETQRTPTVCPLRECWGCSYQLLESNMIFHLIFTWFNLLKIKTFTIFNIPVANEQVPGAFNGKGKSLFYHSPCI